MIKHVKNIFLKYPILCLLLGLVISIALDQWVAFEVTEKLGLRHYAGVFTDVALGSYWLSFSVLMVLFLTFRIRLSDSQKQIKDLSHLRAWGVHLFLSLMTTGVFVILLKFIVGRERPIMTGGTKLFSAIPFNLNSVNQSFPSGHTQVIFCVATMLTYLWPRGRFAFLIAASALALTRALTLNHFISDIYVGALIGVFGCSLSVNFYSRWIPKPWPVLQKCNAVSSLV